MTVYKPANVPQDVWAEAIAQCDNVRSLWTPQQTADLLEMWYDNQSVSIIRRYLQKSYECCHAKLTSLGLLEKRRKDMGQMPPGVKYQNFDRSDFERWFR